MKQNNREIVLDVETTGLKTEEGDRIIEMACIELIERIPTGKYLQTYLNPETKKIGKEALEVHGISNEMLTKQPFFKSKIDEFINFFSDSPLIIHNANFDLGFINHELKLCNKPALKNQFVDTVKLAKKKLGGGAVSLDALCKRFKIDISKRKIHGALLDSNLLAEVYIELLGGRQTTLGFSNDFKQTNYQENKQKPPKNRKITPTKLSQEEINLHKNFVKTIKKPLWNNQKY